MGLGALKKAAKNKKTTTTKKKDGPPEFKLTDPVLQNAQKKWLKAKADEKTAKSSLKKNEGLILPEAVKEHLKACQENDKYYSSIKAVIENEEGKEEKITIGFTNKYSAIPSEHEDSLRQIYGDDYDRYFKERATATLTNKAVNDEEFIGKIADLLGDDFDDFFEVKTFIAPEKEYHEQRMKNKDLAEKHQQAETAGLVRPNKPSVKQG